MQIAHPPKPDGFKFDYNYFYTDESFDYNGPFGPDIHYTQDVHGFSIYIDGYTPNLETVEGFGYFATPELDEAKTSPAKFIKWLQDSKDLINAGDFEGDVTEEIIDELISFVSDLKDKAA